MFFQRNNFQSRIKRLFVLQESTINNYNRIEKITTDTEVINIINQLRSKHQAFEQTIRSAINKNKLYKNPFRRVRNYLEERWKKVVTNLIVNNKVKLFEHLWQAEIKLLQELQPVLQKFSEDKKTYTSLSKYEQAIYQNLDIIDLAIRKIRDQRSIAA